MGNSMSEEAIYQLNLVWGVVNIVFSLLGLYFVYRWGVTLLSTDASVRKILMGEPMASWFEAGNQLILILAAAYLGFKFTHVLISTARWELSMEKSRKDIMGKRAARKQQKEQQEQSRSTFSVSDFT